MKAGIFSPFAVQSDNQARSRSVTSGNREQRWSGVIGRWRSCAVDPIWNRRAMSWGATGLEYLDDEHPAAAARTKIRECPQLAVAGAVGITGFSLWRRHVEQLTRSCCVVSAPAVGEQTIVTDTVETVVQDVDGKAADDRAERRTAFSVENQRIRVRIAAQ